MGKINMTIDLKFYDQKYVAYYDDRSEVELVEVEDVETIKELLDNGIEVYGVNKETVFPDEFDEYVEEYIQGFAEANGYEGIEDRLKFDSEAFGKVRTAIKEYVKSLGEINDSYEVLDGPETTIKIVVEK